MASRGSSRLTLSSLKCPLAFGRCTHMLHYCTHDRFNVEHTHMFHIHVLQSRPHRVKSRTFSHYFMHTLIIFFLFFFFSFPMSWVVFFLISTFFHHTIGAEKRDFLHSLFLACSLVTLFSLFFSPVCLIVYFRTNSLFSQAAELSGRCYVSNRRMWTWSEFRDLVRLCRSCCDV